MTLTELPWLFLGRRIRPLALGLSLANLVIGIGILVLHHGPGDSLDMFWPGTAVGLQAVLATVLLWAGFWCKSDRMMQWGLLLTAGAWASRAFFIFRDSGPSDQSVQLSACWVFIAVGSYVLERATGDAAMRVRRP